MRTNVGQTEKIPRGTNKKKNQYRKKSSNQEKMEYVEPIKVKLK